MARKKKKVRKGNFIARLQKRPKIRAIRAKIRKQKAISKKLSKQYKSALRTESKKIK
jgi:hypothetical protein